MIILYIFLMIYIFLINVFNKMSVEFSYVTIKYIILFVLYIIFCVSFRFLIKLYQLTSFILNCLIKNDKKNDL